MNLKLTLSICLLSMGLAQAQNRPAAPAAAPAAAKGLDIAPTPSRVIKAEESVVTQNTITVNGKAIPYKATAGTMPVWNAEGQAIAGLFYTYYERTDVKNKATRPLVISFNGGPGSASVWMHIAYTGPVILNIDDEGYPIQPYGYKDNPYSILDVADIVYVDPVNTGYSRPTSKDVAGSNFFGVRADIKYLAEWINTFVTRNDRWASPKFLIGESYGTTRVSGLAHELQSSHWMYLNGVILVSPTELGIARSGPTEAALRLPYYAATAWYHKKLPAELQNKDLTAMLPEVENFTIQELLPAMALGQSLDPAKKKQIVAKMAKYSGLSEQAVASYNFDVPMNFFWKELLRDQSFTVGRLDSRYKGIDKKDAGDRPDYNAELTSWLHSFTPAINMYLRNGLNYKTDLKYNMFGPVHPWDNSGDNTGENLRQAMAINPYLHVLVQSGYYDGACDYFNAKYNMWQLDPTGKLKDRMFFEGYRSGHMMYLRKEDLKSSNEHVRKFILNALPKPNQPAMF